MNQRGVSAWSSATACRRPFTIRALLCGLLVAGLLLAPAAEAADWSGASELSGSSSRGADQLVIDANSLGDFAAAWAQSPSDSIATVVKPSNGSPAAPQMFVGDFDDPDIAIGGNSVGVLTFEDDAGDTSIYAASKASGSSAFTAAAAFSGDGNGAHPPSAAQPSAAVNHLGTGMLMFARDYYYPPSYSGIAEAIEGRVLLNPATNAWNAGADLNGDVYDPRSTEVSVAADGSAFLGISVFTVGPCWGLDTAVLENNGTGSANPAQFALDCAGGKYNGIYPSNDRLPNGDVVMAFRHTDNNSVNFLDLPKARANAGSTNLETQAVRLDDPAGHQRASGRVLVRTDAAGNAVVVWYDSNTSGDNNPESMLARYRPAGGAWGPVEVISSGEDYSGALDFDMDDAGNGYFVYERTDGANQEIVAAERAPGASGWTTPELLSENQGIVGLPQVAAGSDGQAFASWVANGDDGVFYARIEPDEPPDSDGDGTPDAQDDCPAVAGPASNDGCPVLGSDGDGDGVPDGEDACPARPGTVANQGCPADVDPACADAKAELAAAKKKLKKAKKKLKKAKKRDDDEAIKKAKKKVKKAKKAKKRANQAVARACD